MILNRIIRCSLRARFIRAHVLLCTAVLELVTRHYDSYMVRGEYCTFSAFSTMVSRLALDHIDHYLNILPVYCVNSLF